MIRVRTVITPAATSTAMPLGRIWRLSRPGAGVPDQVPDAGEEMVPERRQRDEHDQRADPRGEQPVDEARSSPGPVAAARNHQTTSIAGQRQPEPGDAVADRHDRVDLRPVDRPIMKGESGRLPRLTLSHASTSASPSPHEDCRGAPEMGRDPG